MTTPQPLTAFLEQSDEFRKACATIYQPLDAEKSQIRLVHIQPAVQDEDIHLTLEVVSLDDPPFFQAISYTWGNPSPVAHVYLHDLVYNVTQNQHEALRRFRLVDQVRTMWMDVLCINEDDVEERGSQVGMMSRIYSTSRQTQIWLGEADISCNQGLTDEKWRVVQTWFWEHRDHQKMIEMLKIVYENEEFSHQAQLTSDFKEAFEQPDGIMHGAIQILKLLGSDLHYWELPSCFLDSAGEVHLSRPWFESMQALKAILQKPYWNRVWTVQEAILSPSDANVHIGAYEIPFSYFLDAGKATLEHSGTSVACCGTMSNMIMYEDDRLDQDDLLSCFDRCETLYIFLRDLDSQSGKLGFDEALQLSNKMNAFDPRDYVYGVLGFVSQDVAGIVDYSLTTSEVFQRATYLCWLSRGNLGFLKKGSLDCEGRMPGLPSWCIDFTNSETLSFKFYETFFENESVDWDTVDIDFDVGRIVVQSLCLGAIKSRFAQADAPYPKITDATLKIITNWQSRIKSEQIEPNTDLDPRTNRSFFRQFFDTIFRDTQFDMKDGNTDIRRLEEADWEEIEYWWKMSSYGSKAAEWDNERQNEVAERTRRLSLAFYLGLADSTLAVTSDNQLSLVPLVAEPGDLIFHVTGCCMPLVLREVKPDLPEVENELKAMSLDTDTDRVVEPAVRTFRLVGPCYVKGLMGSQGIEGLQSERIALI